MQEKNASFSVDVASLGVHLLESGDSHSYRIQVWAPSASAVYLVGDSFGWEIGRPMTAKENGVWEASYTAKTPLDGQAYKFRIVNGQRSFYRPDPFAYKAELGGGKASLFGEKSFSFSDSAWRHYAASKTQGAPCHIYEADLALFEEKSLAALAKNALPHLKSLGVTVFLLPAFTDAYPTFDIGDGEDLAALVNLFHENGIGVMMTLPDRVPEALREYDGSPLFEKEEDRSRFDLTSAFTVAYLTRIAKTLVTRYHIDGFSLRMGSDSVAMAEALRAAFPSSLLLVTDTPCQAADLVWDDARKKALDDYFACNPYFRKHLHDALKIPSGDRLLPENKGERESRMSRFFGSYEDKFANNRVYSTFAAFTGRCLYTYCANEIAPFDRKSRPQWFMLSFEPHRRFLSLRKALGALYLDTPALWQENVTVLYEQAEDNLLALQKGELIGIFNFSAVPKELSLAKIGAYTLVFHSDNTLYGGNAVGGQLATYRRGCDTVFDLPPLCAVIIKHSIK